MFPHGGEGGKLGNTILDDGEKSVKLISFGVSIVGAYSVAACG